MKGDAVMRRLLLVASVAGIAAWTGLQLVVAVAGAANGATMSGGALDPTFGRGGIALTDVGGELGFAHAVAVEPDGRVVAAGTVYRGGSFDFALVRHTRAGALDVSFGRGGIVLTNLSVGSSEEVEAVAIQKDGRIVAVGTSRVRGSEGDFAVVRYTRRGALDVSFGSGGKLVADIDTKSYDGAAAVALQSDGRIVVAGSSSKGGRTKVALVRFTADGLRDASFGSGGKVLTSFAGRDDGAAAVAVQRDGKIVVAGWSGEAIAPESSSGPGRKRIALVRYLPGGKLDASFGSGGKVLTSFSSMSDDGANALALQGDGKVVVAGWSNGDFDSGWSGEGFALARYSRRGKLDESFGSGGKVLTSPGTGSVARAVIVQKDGKIVAVGDNGKRAQPSRDFRLVRYTTNGALDASFGRGGTVLTNLGVKSADFASAAAVQPDGRLVVAGSTSAKRGDFALARYTK